MGRCGRISCSLPAAIKLPVKVSEPMMTSSPISAIWNLGHVGSGDVVFRDADQRRGKRAKRVAQRGSLRHGGHLHHAKGHADAAPMISAMMIHLYWSTCGSNSVATTATAEAISPTRTPRMAETGELSHFMRQNEADGR